jgi:riboflavin biosynthesis pyrimidine reductase
VVIFCAAGAALSAEADRIRSLGVEVVGIGPPERSPIGEKLSIPQSLSISEALSSLHWRGVTHLLAEPGPTLARSFFDAGLADRLWRFRSRRTIGQATAPAACAPPDTFVPTRRLEIGGDALTEYLHSKSGVFSANEPSADWEWIDRLLEETRPS